MRLVVSRSEPSTLRPQLPHTRLGSCLSCQLQRSPNLLFSRDVLSISGEEYGRIRVDTPLVLEAMVVVLVRISDSDVLRWSLGSDRPKPA